jgi:hypothetical protein
MGIMGSVTTHGVSMKRYWLFLLVFVLTGAALASPPQQIDNIGAFTNAARIDMEIVADAALGADTRPEGWTANADIQSGTMASDLWFDSELLANEVFGEGLRPPDWFGITSDRTDIIARNVRHDLELMADREFNDASGIMIRPEDWQGASSRFRCSRTLQNVIRLARVLLGYELLTLESTLNYCASAQVELEERLANDLGFTSDPRVPELSLAVRGDLERLADEKLGLNVRPPGYIRNVDPESPTLLGDIFLDLETLANETLGSNVRPENWIGVVSNNPYISWRNLRHDLELLADNAIGQDLRPRGWQRETLLERCEPELIDLVHLLAEYEFVVDAFVEPNYCAQVEAAANTLADNPPVEDVVVAEAEAVGERRFRAESEAAFTYLDVGARQYMGIMPDGTEFRAWYRNFGDSGMMFVSGEEFAVFIDRRWTSMGQEIFDSLPTLEGVAPLTFCDAGWCNGPGPTPTPTGSGPLELLLAGATAPAPPELAEIGEKNQVSWNNIRVTYLSDSAEARTAQVALEICTEPAQINCEPVLRVFDNAAGAPRTVVSQYNGLNVFEFVYGYTSNLIVEGSTLTSPDIWISDPSIR